MKNAFYLTIALVAAASLLVAKPKKKGCMKYYDTDKNKTVSKKEFDTWNSNAFKKYDADKDGNLNKKEWKNLKKAGCKAGYRKPSNDNAKSKFGNGGLKRG